MPKIPMIFDSTPQNASVSLLQSHAAQHDVTPTGKSSWFMTYGRQKFIAAPGGPRFMMPRQLFGSA